MGASSVAVLTAVLWALAILPADPDTDISVSELCTNQSLPMLVPRREEILSADPDADISKLFMLFQLLIVAAAMASIILCDLRSRSSNPPPLSAIDASAREGYRCLFSQAGQSQVGRSLQLIVTLACGRTIPVLVPRSASVNLLLAVVDKQRGSTHGSLSLRLLTSMGKELQRGYALTDYNLHSNALLREPPGLLGGMQCACCGSDNRSLDGSLQLPLLSHGVGSNMATEPEEGAPQPGHEVGVISMAPSSVLTKKVVTEAEARQKLEAFGTKVTEDDQGRVIGLDFSQAKLECQL